RATLAAERRQVLRTLIARESDAGSWATAARFAEQLLAADPGSLEVRLRLVELLALAGDALGAHARAGETRALMAETTGGRPPDDVEFAVARALTPAAAPDRRAVNGFPRIPEMVGRATQFHSVVERWRSALEGRGGAVLLTGEAGIGKTRMARELARRFSQDRSLVLRASCYALEQSEPLAPFLEMLGEAHGAPGLGGASAANLAVLAALVPDVALRFRDAVEPRHLPILPQAVASALLDAFGAIALEAPLAIIVEDLHWAAPATIEFAHRLARHALSHPLLLVATSRDHGASVDTTRALRTLAASPAVEEVALDSLDEADVTDLLGSIAELPPEVAGCCLPEQLVEHAGGIPLYVLEVLKDLYDTGYLTVQDGRWVRYDAANPEDGELPLPASGIDILRSRLRKLGPQLVHTLTALAVWGREASDATVAELAGIDPAQTEESLLVLERRHLVSRHATLLTVAHEEIGAAALELAPVELVSRLHARAASLAASQAADGSPADWMVAAMHAVAAGDTTRGATWAARAANEAERASGREAGREALLRAVAAAPEASREELRRLLRPVLDRSWTAARWLDEHDGTARRRRFGVAAAAVALVFVSAVGAVLILPLLHSREQAGPLGGASLAIGWGMPGRPDSVRALTIDAGFVGRPADLASLPVPTRQGFYPNSVRPGRRSAALACVLPGVDPTAVCLRDLERGTTTTLVRFAGDAAPVGWLPDGSALIVLLGRVTRAGGYAHELVLVDSTGRTIRTITRDSATYEGAWASPLGDRIALLRAREQRLEAAIVDLRGAVIAVVDWCDRSTKITWSPDGQRLACLLEETQQLLIGEARPQSWPTHVTFPGPAESGPIWSADGRYLAVSIGGRRPGVYVVDREGLMEPRLVASFPAPPRLVGWMPPGSAPPLHKIDIKPDSLRLAVGSTTTLQAMGLGPSAEPLGPAVVHWFSTDSSVARVDEDGRVVADRPGRTAVVAGYGLERVDDTAYVRVDSAPARLLLDEDFEHGLNPSRWRTYGQPPPEVLPGAGRGGSAGFHNNGTYSHTSGIALRAALALDRGLTIEYWAAIPVTRPLWQSVKVGLYSAAADSFHAGFGPDPASDVAAVSLEAPNPNDPRRQMMALLSDVRPNFKLVALPRRLADGSWHRYRLVIYPRGEVRWFADGIEMMPPGRANTAGRMLWTLVIAGRSVGTRAMVDDVKVWEGVVLDRVQPPAPAGRRVSGGRARP
ncbi:MAG TPA: AAA family ATPase, partial [Gemmatimonadales bacterium]|nr:AAA family ATPase [Gemmatimonadales bacterium]